jgi:hypothetical protein
MCPIPNLDDFFDVQVPVQVKSIVLTQGLNGKPLRFPLQVWYASQLLQKGSPVNRSISYITSGAADKPWCGPVVVLNTTGLDDKVTQTLAQTISLLYQLIFSPTSNLELVSCTLN